MLSYIFLIISVLAQLLPMIASKTKDAAYNSALYSISIVYFVVQLIISFLGYTILVNALKFITVTSVILLLIYAGAFVVIMQIAFSGTAAKKYENRKAFLIDKIQADAERMKSQTSDNDLTALLNKLSDAIRFGNLYSPKEANDVENHILDEMSNLEKNIASDRTRDAKKNCENILALLSERNMICKLYKE